VTGKTDKEQEMTNAVSKIWKERKTQATSKISAEKGLINRKLNIIEFEGISKYFLIV
jgi:hypothetical protein